MVAHASTHLKRDAHSAAPQLCGECLSFAPLQNMVGAGAVVVLPAAVQHDHAAPPDSVDFAPQRAFTAFRSRAPPGSF